MWFRTSCMSSVCRTLGVVFGEPTDPKQYGSVGARIPTTQRRAGSRIAVPAGRNLGSHRNAVTDKLPVPSARGAVPPMTQPLITVYTKPACVQCNATYKAL